MEIKDFIQTALEDIDEALKEAQKNTGKHYVFHAASKTEFIEFDLAVVSTDTSSQTKDKEGRARISVISIGLGKQSALSETNQVTSRIKFKVFPN